MTLCKRCGHIMGVHEDCSGKCTVVGCKCEEFTKDRNVEKLEMAVENEKPKRKYTRHKEAKAESGLTDKKNELIAGLDNAITHIEEFVGEIESNIEDLKALKGWIADKKKELEGAL